ncbi:MAG TPA: DUF1385 domain-containing protein [Candidatus Bathyarchaeota archaeon]|nr:DUF1385 domain-containing protein [Candidatus Bathyarchaeota archaeon]
MSIMSEKPEESLAYGGQALIEGVMMRSGETMVMCVRQPDQEIATFHLTVNNITKKNKLLGLPFVRGIAMLFETMYFGVKAMMQSANVALEDEEFTLWDYVLLLVMLLVMNGLFIAIPYVLTNYLGLNGLLFNVVESVIRLGLFMGYLFTISQWGEVARVFQYHGAEHKAINAYEGGSNMEINDVAKYPRLNPRCGTSFMFFTVLTSIALFALIPRTNYLLSLGYRLALIPVIAGVSYELLKLSDKYRNSALMKMLIAPGLWFQRLTTKEPTEDMLEVAVKALQEVKAQESKME